MRNAGADERGSQHWGLLIKVGLVDPLMKVQPRGLLSALLSRWLRGVKAVDEPAEEVGRLTEVVGRGLRGCESGAVQEALIHPGVMPRTVKEDIQRRCIFAASRS